MGFISEFKTFALKGNVVDLAVGVIIGAGFQKIVTSLVSDIIMPPISALQDDEKGFLDKFISLDGKKYESLAKAKELGAPVLAYGSFIQTVIDFTILAFIIFLMVRAINSLKRKEEAKPAPTEPTTTEKLLMEIRDSLKK